MTADAAGPSADEVRAALEHLYENLALAQTPLAARMPHVAAADLQERAQRLRALLLGGIEALQPARQEPFGSRNSRSYDVLSLRYIEGMSVTQVADELSLVERQVYRDLRRAYEDLAQVLQPQTLPLAAAPAPAVEGGQLQQELARLVARPRRLDPGQALRSALHAVQPLVGRRGATITVDIAEPLPAVSADEGILRQLLTQVLSLATQSAGEVQVALRPQPSGRLEFTARFVGAQGPPRAEALLPLQRLAEAQGFSLAAASGAEGVTTLSVGVTAAQPHTVLVVEDNEGAIELYRRYLSRSKEWQVVGATDPRVSYDLAARLRPAAIILDIMMPQQDGWSVLQVLRAQPQTSGVPVIVCSVFDDPELAAALGATLYLKKPVSREELLAALRRCL